MTKISKQQKLHYVNVISQTKTKVENLRLNSAVI